MRVVVAIVGVCVLTVWTRAVVESRASYQLGQAALEHGDTPSAVTHFRHAAQWFAPVGTRSNRALRALIEVGREAEARDDLETALLAYRSARQAMMGRRSLTTYNGEHLTTVHECIARLMALQRPGSADASTYERQLNDWPARTPTPTRRLVASVGFVGWLALWLLAWLPTPWCRANRYRLLASGATAWIVWLVAVGTP